MAQIIIEVSDEVLADVKKYLESEYDMYELKVKDPLAMLKHCFEGELNALDGYIEYVCGNGCSPEENFGINPDWYECDEEGEDDEEGEEG